MELNLLALSDVAATHVPCALKIKVADREGRIPTHFILLLDVSGSMANDHKLENVKRCAGFLLSILNAEDSLSLITFGDRSEIVVQNQPVDSLHKSVLESKIQSLQTDGMTNLSAGFVNVVKVLRESPSIKTGVVLLTDGHANVGVQDPSTLRTLAQNIRSQFSHVSFSFLAYGTDHNAELLKSFAEENQGSYSIVETIEDTASSMGDVLGGILSCAYQNVEVAVPASATVHGTYATEVRGDSKVIRLGDLYADTETLLLIDLPSEAPVRVTGTGLPSFAILDQTLTDRVLTCPEPMEITLTRLRHTCSAHFKAIRLWNTLSTDEKQNLETAIEQFSEEVAKPLYDGNAVAEMLRTEAISLKAALQGVQQGENLTSQLLAHETFVALGRGASRSIQTPSAPRRRGGGARWNVSPPSSDDEDTDPVHMVPSVRTTAAFLRPPTPPSMAQTMSPYQGRTQRRITSLMRTMSQAPDHEEA